MTIIFYKSEVISNDSYLAWGYKEGINYLASNGCYYDHKDSIKSLISDFKRDNYPYNMIYKSNLDK